MPTKLNDAKKTKKNSTSKALETLKVSKEDANMSIDGIVQLIKNEKEIAKEIKLYTKWNFWYLK